MQREKKIENLSNINQKTKILILKKKKYFDVFRTYF